MAKNETKRLRPIQLQADQDALTAIQNLGDYKPANPAYGAEKLGTALSAMQTAQQAEVNAANVLSRGRAIPRSPPNGTFTTPCWASRSRWWRSTETISMRCNRSD